MMHATYSSCLLKIGIIGFPGRMAMQLVEMLLSHKEARLSAVLARPGHSRIGRPVREWFPNAPELLVEPAEESYFQNADVWIEFAQTNATLVHAEYCRKHRKPLLVATTGHAVEVQKKLHEIAQEIPLLLAPNTSLGVAVLNELVEQAAKMLGSNYQQEIFELHHRQKRDAPSGSAMQLARTLEKVAHARQEPSSIVVNRTGENATRKAGEIGIAALRGGQVIGEHTVFFLGEEERIEITHRASDRKLFARGAITAAVWLAKQTPGWYAMCDCLRPDCLQKEK